MIQLTVHFRKGPADGAALVSDIQPNPEFNRRGVPSSAIFPLVHPCFLQYPCVLLSLTPAPATSKKRNQATELLRISLIYCTNSFPVLT